MPDYKDQPVSFISINTRNPKGQVKSEIKRYKMNYPVHLGRGTSINKDFKVVTLPRIILIGPDKTIVKDEIFLEADDLRKEIDLILEKIPEAKSAQTESESDLDSESGS